MKIQLTHPNDWCLNNHLTENKIYEIISNPPQAIIFNDIGLKIEAPLQCFTSLKDNRKMKLEKLAEIQSPQLLHPNIPQI